MGFGVGAGCGFGVGWGFGGAPIGVLGMGAGGGCGVGAGLGWGWGAALGTKYIRDKPHFETRRRNPVDSFLNTVKFIVQNGVKSFNGPQSSAA